MEQSPFIGCGQIVPAKRFSAARDDVWVIGKVSQWLSGGVGEHADADARAKHHREPRKATEFGATVVRPQTHVPGSGQHCQ